MLDLAQRNSDELVKTERIAMNAVKGLFRDEEGKFVIQRAPDSDYALRIMHDAKYHRDKASIMKPIDEFLHTLDKRTAAEVTEKKAEASLYEELLAFCITMNFIGILIGSFLLHRSWQFINKLSNEQLLDNIND